MTHRARSVLMHHWLSLQGDKPAICVGLDGYPTDCTWKASRRNGANDAGIQHIEHQAQLIAEAYRVDILELALIRNIRDLIDDETALLAAPSNDFTRGRLHVLQELDEVLREADE